jgi:quinol-cytochrome oxidoreductase complex cytochrome b subunit
MKIEFIMLGAYLLFECINIYCFLFQRTVRKIRQYAFGTQNIEIQNKFFPDWYFYLFYISQLKYIPLIWIFFINWKYALIAFIGMWLLKLILPIDDYGHIQKIKKGFEKRIDEKKASAVDVELYNIVLEAEKKTL